MAGTVNKVILIGNLGKDPEVRHLSNGTKVCTVPLATSEQYKDKTTGDVRDITDWHNIVMWRGLADIAEKYLKKGSKIYVEGKLRTRTWQDKEGNNRYTTEVIADEMTMLDRPGNNNSSEPKTPSQPIEKNMENLSSDLSAEDDDLPF